VAEWFKATVLKTVVGGSSPWVRIPPCPPAPSRTAEMVITPSLLPGMSSKTVIDEGIAKAKAAGVYSGRKPTVDVEAVKALKVSGTGPAEIAKELGIGRASVYRALAAKAVTPDALIASLYPIKV
jgi:hypothetical protein